MFNSSKTITLIALFLSVAATSQAASLSVSVLDRDGKPTADAVVILMPEGKGSPKATLPANATIAQEKMQFIPAVSIVPLGAKVRFVNNDPWDHHIRSSAAGAAQFAATTDATAPRGVDLRLEGKSDGKPAKFSEVTMDKAGPQSAVLLGCYLHGSMRGHVYVTDSPWAAKTNADGVAVFDDLPDGKVTVKVWQADQLVDLPTQSVTVAAATPAKATVQLQVVARKRRVETKSGTANIAY
jgi:plastocyanin